MKSEENVKKNNRKKTKIIVIFCLIGILLMAVLGFGIGTLAYNFMLENGELQNGDMNIIDTGETNKVDENVLSVELEEKNTPDTNVVPTPTPTPTSSANNSSVDTPYYIKINYGENVVTVYKKDKNRRIYRASKGNDMFLSEQLLQHQECIR